LATDEIPHGVIQGSHVEVTLHVCDALPRCPFHSAVRFTKTRSTLYASASSSL